VNTTPAVPAMGISGIPRRRLIIGGAGFIVAGVALALASELRPMADERTMTAYLAAVASARDRLASVANLYFIAALCLLPGALALGGVASVRGATTIYVGSLMTLAGAVWFVIDGSGMVFLRGLLSAPEQAQAILERVNESGGPMVIALFLFLFSPLVLGIGFRRAHLAGSWLAALWVLSFAVSFAAESQLGADVHAIRTLSSALLGVLVCAIGFVMIRATVQRRSEREPQVPPVESTLVRGTSGAATGQ
jgi:hypothetical protein